MASSNYTNRDPSFKVCYTDNKIGYENTVFSTQILHVDSADKIEKKVWGGQSSI